MAKKAGRPPQTLRDTKAQSVTAYRGTLAQPLVEQAGVKGAEHAQAALNLLELATVGLGAVVTAEVNHTRSAQTVWTWRVVEMISTVPVLAFNGHRNTLGRLAMGVFLGALVESLVDSTPGLTGWAVLPPDDHTSYVIRDE